jgi:hypothetical protein
VYEKGPYLHAHHLLHVEPGNDDVLARYHDGAEIDVRPTRSTWSAIYYVTKQRQWLGEEIEKRRARPWKPSEGSIPGARWSLTDAARTIANANQPPALPVMLSARGGASRLGQGSFVEHHVGG